MSREDVYRDAVWGGMAVAIVCVGTLIGIFADGGLTIGKLLVAVLLGVASGIAAARVGYLILCRIWKVDRR